LPNALAPETSEFESPMLRKKPTAAASRRPPRQFPDGRTATQATLASRPRSDADGRLPQGLHVDRELDLADHCVDVGGRVQAGDEQAVGTPRSLRAAANRLRDLLLRRLRCIGKREVAERLAAVG